MLSRWTLLSVLWVLGWRGVVGKDAQGGDDDTRKDDVPDVAALTSASPFAYKATILKQPPHESQGSFHLQLPHKALRLRGQVIKGTDKDTQQNFTVELLAVGAGDKSDAVYLRAALNSQMSCSNFSYPELSSEDQKAELKAAAESQQWKYISNGHLGDDDASVEIYETDLQRSRVMRVWFSSEDDTILQVEVSRNSKSPKSSEWRKAHASSELRQVRLTTEDDEGAAAWKPMHLTDGWVCDEIHDFVVGLGFLDRTPVRSLQLQETLYALRYLSKDFPSFVATQVLATLGDLAVHVLQPSPPIQAGQEHLSFHFDVTEWSEVKESQHWVPGHVVASIHSDPQYLRLKIGHSGSLEIQLYVEVDSVTVWILAPPHDDQERAQDCVIFQTKQLDLGTLANPMGMAVVDGVETSVWSYADASEDAATVYYDGESDEVLKAEFDYRRSSDSSDRIELGIEDWTTTHLGHQLHNELVMDHMQPQAECRPEMSEVIKSSPGIISKSSRPIDAAGKSETGQPPEVLELQAVSRMLACMGLLGDGANKVLQDIRWEDSSANSGSNKSGSPSPQPKDKPAIFDPHIKFFSFDFESHNKVLEAVPGILETANSRGHLRVDLEHRTLVMTAAIEPDISTVISVSIADGVLVAESRTNVQGAWSCWAARGQVDLDFTNPFAAGMEEGNIGDTDKERVYRVPLDHTEKLYYRVDLQGNLLGMLFTVAAGDIARGADIEVEHWTASMTPLPPMQQGDGLAGGEMHTQTCDYQQDNLEDLLKWPLLRIVLGASKEH